MTMALNRLKRQFIGLARTFSLVLAVLIGNILISQSANAAVEINFSSKVSPEELTLVETVEGKLVHAKEITESKPPHRVMRAVITAYSSTPDQTDEDPFIAASGKRVHDGMIAANGFPFGTKVKIPSLYGDKIFTVEDRMNSRYGQGRMDIWMDAPRPQVLAFGVKRVYVEIYYPEAKTKLAKAK